jgi:hypothetical protein
LVGARRGASSLGCLFSLLIAAAALYFGVHVGEAYWRFYEFQDDMQQEARFASHNANETIINHLRASADSLELPADAQRIAIRRSQSAIIIESAYTEYVEFPMYVRQIVFHPYAESTF